MQDKLERQDATDAVQEAILDQYAPAPGEGASEDELERAKARRADAQLVFDKLEKSIIRERIAVDKKRPDGRSEHEIREISIEVGVAPRAHGSALFTRGQTQALSVAALGTLKEEMRLDTLGLQTKKYYFHHYNFRRSRSARRDGSVPSAATSATARSPSARSCRWCPRSRSSRTRSGSSRTSSSPTAVLDGLRLRFVAVTDGRRRAGSSVRLPASRWA